MTLTELLARLFPDGHQLAGDNRLFHGEGRTPTGPVAVIGTGESTTIGIAEIVYLGRSLLRVLRETPGRPVLLLVDNSGQKMAMADELLGLNQYIAHLVQIQDLARRRGHQVLALVYGNSIAGGFIAFGLCAGQTYALPESNTSVMNLPAIARITKLPLEYLEEVSRTVSVFAPGVENFFRTGGIEDIWSGDLSQCLARALGRDQAEDRRAELGLERGGRPLASQVINRIRHA